MSDLVFEAPIPKTIPVRGERAHYPVHRIFCVGRNYAAHATEMGVEVDREAPFYFTKSPSAALDSGATLAYPPATSNFHFEMELVVAIGRPTFNASPAQAAAAVYAYGCGLDMTRRDLQLAAREKGRPWDVGKDVEGSAVFGHLTKADQMDALGPQRIHLEVNGSVQQDAHLGDLIHGVGEIIEDLSTLYHLVPGDLIMTGTPAGVGPVVAGDHITGGIDGLDPVELVIGPPGS